jgi:hypothetical protein
MSPLPKLSHAQFAVLSCLMGGPVSGRAIRESLAEFGIRQGGPAFYQLMARMEDANFVAGSYQQKIVKSQIIRERHYRITAVGRSAWTGTRQFYVRAGVRVAGAKGLAHG